MQRINNNRRIMIMSFKEHCENHMTKQYDYVFRIYPDGRTCFVKNGQEFSKELIEATYPTPSPLFYNEHCQEQHNWNH